MGPTTPNRRRVVDKLMIVQPWAEVWGPGGCEQSVLN